MLLPIQENETVTLPEPQQLEEHLSQNISQLLDLRWDLHRHPCLSGQESDSAQRVKNWLLERTKPSAVVESLGETGLAVVFDSGVEGSTVMLRAELDALPMDDLPDLPHCSTRPGIAHKCGHDGHTTALAGAGLLLEAFPLPMGKAILLFQPAEETGVGARAVLADPQFSQLSPDWAFGFHNVPGHPVGQVIYRTGPFAPASEGMKIKVLGSPSHAGEPHKGRNPASAVAQILLAFAALPQEIGGLSGGGLITPTGIQMGHGDFGLSPGEAELYFTVRAENSRQLSTLVAAMRDKSSLIASCYGLQMEYTRHDPFPATVNTPEGVEVLHRAFQHLGCKTEGMNEIFPWSEDFGEFLMRMPGAFFSIGSGLDCPPLHSREYDFPDQLIQQGATALFTAAWIGASSKRAAF